MLAHARHSKGPPAEMEHASSTFEHEWLLADLDQAARIIAAVIDRLIAEQPELLDLDVSE
jgi:hypothetical protein